MVAALDHVPPDLPPQDTQRALTFAVVGAGASGVELATKMADLLRDAFKRRALRGEPRVLVIEMGDRVVPGMGEEIREIVDAALRESHVEVHTLTQVVRLGEKTLVFEHNGHKARSSCGSCLGRWGARKSGNRNSESRKDQPRLDPVHPTLQVTSHANLFALGDVAYFQRCRSHVERHRPTGIATGRSGSEKRQGLTAGDELQTNILKSGRGGKPGHGTRRGARRRKSVWWAASASGEVRSLYRATADVASPPTRRGQLVLSGNRAKAVTATGPRKVSSGT